VRSGARQRRAERRIAMRRARRASVGCHHPAPWCALAADGVLHEHHWQAGTEYVIQRTAG
jgi:hypothetical protein